MSRSSWEPTELAGLTVLRSPLLCDAGVQHAFTTRCGGVSQPPYEGLNLGYTTGDRHEHIVANRERVCRAFGLDLTALRFVRQVHGKAVISAAAISPPSDERYCCAGDALVAAEPGVLVGVRVADCVPVLLASPKGLVVAAVHAGWRGLVAGVIEAAVRAVSRSASCDAADLVAAVGPHISARRYTVGDDVAAQFSPDHLTRLDDGTTALDLTAAAVGQLRALGVEHCDAVELCTYERDDLFFSHRRDGAQTGRQGAFITANALTLGRPA